MKKAKGSRPKPVQFCNGKEDTNSKESTNVNEGFHFERKEYILYSYDYGENTKKSNKSVQVNFNKSNLIKITKRKEKNNKKVDIKEEDNMSEDCQLKFPQEKKKTVSINFESKQNNNNTKKKEESRRKNNNSKHKSTYDPRLFRSSTYEPKCGRFKIPDAPPIKLNVTLKDIGMEGFDSYKTEETQDQNQQNLPKKELKETEDIENLREQMILKKVQEAWEKRKEQEKKTNTYDPKLFYTSSNFSPKPKLKPEEIEPIKLKVDLKDIGMDGLDSFRPENQQEINSRNHLHEDEIDPKKQYEQMRMKQIQEEWEMKKRIEKKINTYDPNLFRASHHSPKSKKEPLEVEPVKLNVELKDIGLEGLDSYEHNNNNKTQVSPSKSKINETEDIEDLREKMILKKVQEAWEKRKEQEKNTNTYDPKLFYGSHYSPTSKLNPENIEPIKLKVELKDIGLEGLDSYSTKNEKESEQQSPTKYTIQKTKEKIDPKKQYEQMRMKKIQEEWELKKKVEKTMNTYDPKLFRASHYSPKSKREPEKIKPIPLTVELKDIGLEGLNSYSTKNEKESKQQSPTKYTIKKTKEEVDPKKQYEQMRMKKIQEEWELKKEVEKTMNTYDPKIFAASHYSPKSKREPEKVEPIKLTIGLKDIGLEGLDSYEHKSNSFSPTKQVQEPIRNQKSSNNNNNDDDEENKYTIKQPSEKSTHSNFRTKRRQEDNSQHANTYNSDVFKTPFFESNCRLEKEEIQPIKLNVTLKDIGLEGLDSYTSNKAKKVKIQIPPNNETRKQKECENISNNSQKNLNASIQKVHNKDKNKKTEKQTRKSTYDRSVFYTSSCAFTSAQLTAKSYPIKLNVTLKDIGLEGLDSI